MHLNLPSILPRILLTADAQPSLHDGRKALVSEPVAFYKRHTFQLTHTQTYQVIPTLNSVTGMIDNGAYDMMMSLWFDGAGSVDQSGQIRCARLQNDRFFFTRGRGGGRDCQRCKRVTLVTCQANISTPVVYNFTATVNKKCL